MPYLTVDQIDAALTAFGTGIWCTVFDFPGPPAAGGPTAGGRTMSYAQITDPSLPVTPRLPVLITGGMHAREWAPPDALISFIEKLVAAASAGGPAVYPRWVQRTWPGAPATPTPVVYPEWSVDADAVADIAANLDLYIVPLMNPDGREYSQLPMSPNELWRKNRGPTAAIIPCSDVFGLDQSVGTDLNRNFDIAWRFEDYYEPAELPAVRTAMDPCVDPAMGSLYRGDGAFSEPETRNFRWLLDTKDIRCLVDVHSAGRLILHPWGLSEIVSDDTRNFQNPTLNGSRTTISGEYMATLMERRHALLGGRMQDAITQVATLDARGLPGSRFGSDYTVQPSVALYPHAGICADYQFSRQFGLPAGEPYHAVPVPPERFAFTIECGHLTENRFWPDYDTEFPKIEREVHAALWGFLSSLASPARGPSSSWPILPVP